MNMSSRQPARRPLGPMKICFNPNVGWDFGRKDSDGNTGKFSATFQSWKRSGSGTYREISRIEVPQTKEGILKFAADNRYSIEWRGPIPADRQSA